MLASVQEDLFTEEGLTLFKRETARLLAEQRRTTTPQLATLKAELAELDQQIAHYSRPLNPAFVPNASGRIWKRPKRNGCGSKAG